MENKDFDVRKFMEEWLKGYVPRGKKGSVHYGSNFRYEEADKQSKLEKVDIEKIICYTNQFLESCGMKKSKKNKYELEGIKLKDLYNDIKQKEELKKERDIVWMKFTKDNYLGVVAVSNDINFNIPLSSEVYNEKKINADWKYNTSGILIHKLGKEWDTSFVLIFPLKNIPKGYNSHNVETAIGNYLIEKGVPILDFYSHRY